MKIFNRLQRITQRLTRPTTTVQAPSLPVTIRGTFTMGKLKESLAVNRNGITRAMALEMDLELNRRAREEDIRVAKMRKPT